MVFVMGILCGIVLVIVLAIYTFIVIGAVLKVESDKNKEGMFK